MSPCVPLSLSLPLSSKPEGHRQHQPTTAEKQTRSQPGTISTVMDSSVLAAIAGRNAAQQRRVVEKKKGETINVPEGSGLLVTGCSDCVVSAPGRSSSVTVERCNGVKLDVGSVVASLEVIHCTDVQVSVARYYSWREERDLQPFQVSLESGPVLNDEALLLCNYV